jgi:Putative transmembrane protein (PGPGW)
MRGFARVVLGWVLVVLGLAALILPGPGLLLLLAGLILLSQEYEWAARRVEPVRKKAFDVAQAGVSSPWRIAASALGSLAIIAVGVIWWLDPRIPQVGPVGPNLPLGGWTTGSGLVISGLAALGLVVYSVKRFRPGAVSEAVSGVGPSQ